MSHDRDAPAPGAPAPAGNPGPGTGPGPGHDAVAADVVRRWRGLAPDTVLLDGFHALKHALRFGAEVPLALTEDRDRALALAADLAPDLSGALAALLRPVPSGTLAGLVARPHPTGVAALAVRGSGQAAALRAEGPRAAPLVVLDDPRHLGNIGAVIRVAAGCGASGVLTTGTVDPWHPNVLRASAGLHFATAVERRSVADLPAGPLYALDPDGADLRTRTLPDDALLAFGSERRGLSPELRARADHVVSLPMRPLVSSYNLATSVAITLYHWLARTAD
ncbi:TrmH family RNA methyltransferase [Streptomyces sp. Z26]|uniref:TrmH family RNA methyltransferase n=1 Tax=Streptomyces sp. Z26 TaxID=2500177 RepID=UPI000EF150AB|nr:TrmH family RNA methyltransferase [Streptomyces sp. Z26]RLL67790.1 TrmH family RNA methyltransferase [Streptomyces sp. Z26]